MGWRGLLPDTKRTAAVAPVSIQQFKQRGHTVTMLTFHLDHFTAPAWLTRGAGTSVATGTDDMAGQLRVSSGGPFSVGSPIGPRTGDRVLTLRLPRLPGRVDGAFAREPVRFEVRGGDLFVWLPEWCRGRQPSRGAA